MSPLLYARAQMGLSLAFHILFAAAGIALPALMVTSDVLWHRTRERDYLELSQRLARGTAVLFAVGAVSGTVLSFELGLLWPHFMGTFGGLVGLPFTLEGFAFFTEAVFLGIYLYGRRRVRPGLHLFSGGVVALSGAASAFFVTLVNSFMNLPAGFRWESGGPTDIRPWQAMFSPPWGHETVHVLLSCYEAVAFAMAGIHAAVLLKRGPSTFHRRALALALCWGGVVAVAQPFSGDRSAKDLAQDQPLKLAAMEAQLATRRGAPLRVGPIEVPGGLSLLAYGRADAEVKGLEAFPKSQWPPFRAVHRYFQLMVGCGVALAVLSAVAGVLALLKKRPTERRPFLWAVVLSSPFGLVAMEAGWMVTELGRQPWIVRGAMRTAEAVTPFPYLAAPFWIFALVYGLLGCVVAYLLYVQVARASAPQERVRAVA